jgi:hypothetical protein
MDKLKFEFAPTGGGDVTGSNDPLITPFKGNIFYSLAREAIQNVIDARLPESKDPAEVCFTSESYKASEIPGLYQLKEILKECQIHHRNKPDDFKFYDAAILKIEKDYFIDVLKISDYNTVGLTGTDIDENGNYFNLMKSIGGSTKTGGTGGSFGLGKGAYFGVSSFRTIFVSSVYGNNKYVFQGKARLSSFVRNGEWIQGNGSYGYTRQVAVRNYNDIPKMFKRDEQGTDFYIIGFRTTSDWEKSMIKSVLNFFWFAILKNQLKVSVGNIEISSDNLDELIHEYFSIDDYEENNNPLFYYHAYTDSRKKIFKRDLPTLGKVELCILEGDNFPNQVAYIRKTGMVIQTKHKGSPNHYAATFICENEKGNKILRAMENETHNEWNKDYVKENSPFIKAAQNAEKELNQFVRDSLRELNKDKQDTASEIGGLEEFLPLIGAGESGSGLSGAMSDEASEIETAYEISLTDKEKMLQISNHIDINPNEQELVPGSPSGDLDIIKDLNGDGDGSGDGSEDDEGEDLVRKVKNINYRAFTPKSSEGAVTHHVLIKDMPYFKGTLKIRAGTDESYDSVEINSVKDSSGHLYKTDNNKIEGVSIGADGRLALELTFDINEKLSLNISGYESK